MALRRFLLAVTLAGMATALVAAGGCGGANTQEQSVSQSSVTDTTITASSSPALYSFAVCGDNRTEGINNGVLGRIVDSAKSRGAAFIVDTGDVSTVGSRQQLEYYRDFGQARGLTFYSVPGNHDVGKGGVSDAWQQTLGAYYYSFNFQNDHFVILDNADDSTGIDPDQMQWYTADLDAHAYDPHTFIFAHIPVADAGLPSGHVTGEEGSAGLETSKQMVTEAKRAHTADFFFGHIHAFLQYRLNDIPAYVTGGAGAPLVLPAIAGGYYHYLLVTVRKDGKVDVEAVRV